MNDIEQLRMNLMGGMNAYVHELGDEDLLDYWHRILPDDDEIPEELLVEYAENDDLWLEVVQAFAKIVRCD